jgi:K+-sensing histidine kinase KdpD
MQILRKTILPLVTRFIAAVLCIAVTKLVLQPFQSFLDIQVIALIYLLPVMISTVLWGLTPGIVAVVARFPGLLTTTIFRPTTPCWCTKPRISSPCSSFLFVAVVLSQ